MKQRKKPERALERHEASGVERFDASWLQHQTQLHAHPEYQLTLSVAGCGRFRYLGGEARIPAGCLALFHPGEAHMIGNAEHRESWQVRVLHVPATCLEQEGAPLLQPAPLRDPELRASFEQVWNGFDAARAGLSSALKQRACILRARPGLELGQRPHSELVRRCLAELGSLAARTVTAGALRSVSLRTERDLLGEGLGHGFTGRRRCASSRRRAGRAGALLAVSAATEQRERK